MNENDNLNEAHLRLRNLRKSYGLTQEKMAELLEISESLYKENESGKQAISRKTAKAIEKKFDVSADYVYFGALRDGENVWSQILECSDENKILFLLKLLKYFFSENDLELFRKSISKILIEGMGLEI